MSHKTLYTTDEPKPSDIRVIILRAPTLPYSKLKSILHLKIAIYITEQILYIENLIDFFLLLKIIKYYF
jgi:hypothetical protein